MNGVLPGSASITRSDLSVNDYNLSVQGESKRQSVPTPPVQSRITWKGLESTNDVRAGLKTISRDVKTNVRRRLHKSLGAEKLDESVCALCDRLHLRIQCKYISAEDSDFLQKLRTSLGDVDPHSARRIGEAIVLLFLIG